MTKPVILTGIRANNNLHIGNYFGAMLPIIDMATSRSDEYDINFFIPDLHSFTTPIDHSKLYESIMQNARVYTAAGLPLDNPSIHLYRQSRIPAHSELAVLLNNFVGFGEMERMTQFKDKSGRDPDFFATKLMKILSPLAQAEDANIMLPTEAHELIRTYQNQTIFSNVVSVGLFDYPVLMASDILLYNAQYVPVGDDQAQHLEITRDIAERMNSKFGELFVVPQPVAKQHEFFGKDQGLRIKDLLDPSKKMSKSDDTGKGVIFLSDEPEVAAKKIMSATTDNLGAVHYDKTNQPGISNLLDILALLRAQPVQQVAAEFDGMERYGDFKKIVADEMATFLHDFQNRLASVDMAAIEAKLIESEQAMTQVANTTLARVQKAVGLRP